MFATDNVPPIEEHEVITRFISCKSEYRKDGTVMFRLFMPPNGKNEVSVNRLRDASVLETWSVGINISNGRGKALVGRADIEVKKCKSCALDVKHTPILPHNPNHADIVGFTLNKEEQKSMAMKLADSIERPWKPHV